MRLSWSNLWKNQVQGYQTSACTTLECEGWPDGTLLASSPTWPWNNRDIEEKTEVSNPSDVYTLRAVHGIPMLIVHTHTYIYIYIYHYFLAGNMVYTPKFIVRVCWSRLTMHLSRCQSYQVPILSVSFKLGDWRLLSWRVMVPEPTLLKASAFLLADDPVPAVSGCLLPTANPPLACFGEVMSTDFHRAKHRISALDLQPLWGSTLGPRGP